MPDAPSSPATGTNTADPFFVLRDCRELFLRRAAEIVQPASNARPEAIGAFSRALGESFDELAASANRDGFEQTDGLTASRISLVGNDDLELEIRIGGLVSRLKDNERIDHWRTQQRFITLLARPNMSAENNPVGFQPICHGLLALCRNSGQTLEQSLDQLEHVEAFLQARLPGVYAELNAVLDRHHVEPATAQRGRPSQSGADKPADRLPAGNSNPLATLQQTMRQLTIAHDSPLASGELAFTDAGSGNSTLGAAAMVMINHLTERLNALEQRDASDAPTAPTDRAAGRHQALRTWSSRDLDLPLGQPASIALDTLALIFEAIFTTPELPDAVKAAIARLQIPLLKLALLDGSLFADERHPARRLINNMARAAVGLAANSGREHAVCSALLAIADAARNALDAGDRELASALGDLQTLIATRDRLHDTAASPYIVPAREHLASEMARIDTETWLANILGKCAEPAIRSFLADHWLRVMRLASSDGGMTGGRWKESQTTADELLWSVSPKRTIEERKQLLALIPALLKRLNAGLDLLGITRDARAPFLDACFELQTAALRHRPDSAPEPASGEAPSMARAMPTQNQAATAAKDSILGAQLVERDGLRLRCLERTPPATLSRAGVDPVWRAGDWISVDLPGGEKLCGRLCWQGEPPDNGILLFNVDWGYAVTCTPGLLAGLLQSGNARIASTTSLFDVAAETALKKVTAR